MTAKEEQSVNDHPLRHLRGKLERATKMLILRVGAVIHQVACRHDEVHIGVMLCDVAHDHAEGVPRRVAARQHRFRFAQMVIGDLDE